VPSARTETGLLRAAGRVLLYVAPTTSASTRPRVEVETTRPRRSAGASAPTRRPGS